MKPTYQRVREVFDYDPDTGLFRWRIAIACRKISVGDIAGSALRREGREWHREICVDRYRTHLHRLAWFWIMGSWPVDQMDHINRDKTDNRWCNLRPASREQNARNRGVSKHNKLGIKGVKFNSGRFEANIYNNGRHIYLGRFDTADEASTAYIAAARELHGEFCYA